MPLKYYKYVNDMNTYCSDVMPFWAKPRDIWCDLNTICIMYLAYRQPLQYGWSAAQRCRWVSVCQRTCHWLGMNTWCLTHSSSTLLPYQTSWKKKHLCPKVFLPSNTCCTRTGEKSCKNLLKLESLENKNKRDSHILPTNLLGN